MDNHGNLVTVQETLHNLQRVLECSICLELLKDPLSTKCGHQFCRLCISRVLKKNVANCPLCKETITKRGLTECGHLKEIITGVKTLLFAVQLDTGYEVCSQGVLVSQIQQQKSALDKTSTKRKKRQKLITNYLPIEENLSRISGEKNNKSHCKIFNDEGLNLSPNQTTPVRITTHLNISHGFPASKKRNVRVSCLEGKNSKNEQPTTNVEADDNTNPLLKAISEIGVNENVNKSDELIKVVLNDSLGQNTSSFNQINEIISSAPTGNWVSLSELKSLTSSSVQSFSNITVSPMSKVEQWLNTQPFSAEFPMEDLEISKNDHFQSITTDPEKDCLPFDWEHKSDLYGPYELPPLKSNPNHIDLHIPEILPIFITNGSCQESDNNEFELINKVQPDEQKLIEHRTYDMTPFFSQKLKLDKKFDESDEPPTQVSSKSIMTFNPVYVASLTTAEKNIHNINNDKLNVNDGDNLLASTSDVNNISNNKSTLDDSVFTTEMTQSAFSKKFFKSKNESNISQPHKSTLSLNDDPYTFISSQKTPITKKSRKRKNTGKKNYSTGRRQRSKKFPQSQNINSFLDNLDQSNDDDNESECFLFCSPKFQKRKRAQLQKKRNKKSSNDQSFVDNKEALEETGKVTGNNNSDHYQMLKINENLDIINLKSANPIPSESNDPIKSKKFNQAEKTIMKLSHQKNKRNKSDLKKYTSDSIAFEITSKIICKKGNTKQLNNESIDLESDELDDVNIICESSSEVATNLPNSTKYPSKSPGWSHTRQMAKDFHAKSKSLPLQSNLKNRPREISENNPEYLEYCDEVSKEIAPISSVAEEPFEKNIKSSPEKQSVSEAHHIVSKPSLKPENCKNNQLEERDTDETESIILSQTEIEYAPMEIDLQPERIKEALEQLQRENSPRDTLSKSMITTENSYLEFKNSNDEQNVNIQKYLPLTINETCKQNNSTIICKSLKNESIFHLSLNEKKTGEYGPDNLDGSSKIKNSIQTTVNNIQASVNIIPPSQIIESNIVTSSICNTVKENNDIQCSIDIIPPSDIGGGMPVVNLNKCLLPEKTNQSLNLDQLSTITNVDYNALTSNENVIHPTNENHGKESLSIDSSALIHENVIPPTNGDQKQLGYLENQQINIDINLINGMDKSISTTNKLGCLVEKQQKQEPVYNNENTEKLPITVSPFKSKSNMVGDSLTNILEITISNEEIGHFDKDQLFKKNEVTMTADTTPKQDHHKRSANRKTFALDIETQELQMLASDVSPGFSFQQNEIYSPVQFNSSSFPIAEINNSFPVKSKLKTSEKQVDTSDLICYQDIPDLSSTEHLQNNLSRSPTIPLQIQGKASNKYKERLKNACQKLVETYVSCENEPMEYSMETSDYVPPSVDSLLYPQMAIPFPQKWTPSLSISTDCETTLVSRRSISQRLKKLSQESLGKSPGVNRKLSFCKTNCTIDKNSESNLTSQENSPSLSLLESHENYIAASHNGEKSVCDKSQKTIETSSLNILKNENLMEGIINNVINEVDQENIKAVKIQISCEADDVITNAKNENEIDPYNVSSSNNLVQENYLEIGKEKQVLIKSANHYSCNIDHLSSDQRSESFSNPIPEEIDVKLTKIQKLDKDEINLVPPTPPVNLINKQELITKTINQDMLNNKFFNQKVPLPINLKKIEKDPEENNVTGSLVSTENICAWKNILEDLEEIESLPKELRNFLEKSELKCFLKNSMNNSYFKKMDSVNKDLDHDGTTSVLCEKSSVSPSSIAPSEQKQLKEEKLDSTENHVDSSDQSESDEDIQIRKKRKLAVIKEDDSGDDIVSSTQVMTTPLRNVEFTASSGFSTQTEVYNTQQRNQMQHEIETMKEQIKVMEAQLKKQQVIPNLQSDLKPQESEDIFYETSPQSTQDSDNNLSFLSPLSPSPPPPSATLKINGAKHVLPQLTNHIKKLLENDSKTNVTVVQNLLPVKRKSNDLLIFKSANNSTLMSQQQSKSTNEDSTTHKHSSITSPQHNYTDNNVTSTFEEKQLLENSSVTVNKSIIATSANDDINKQDPSTKLITKQERKNQSPHGSHTEMKDYKSPLFHGLSNILISRNMETTPLSCKSYIYRNNNVVLEDLSSVKQKQANWCFIVSGLSKNEMKMTETLATKLGGKLVSKYQASMTHLIVKTNENLCCERTFKYFLAVAGKKWIISYNWVLKCLQSNQLFSEADFEVCGDVVKGDNHFGPLRSRTSSTLLLHNYEICCLGTSPEFSKAELGNLLELCGANTVQKPSLFCNPLSNKLIISQLLNHEEFDYDDLYRKCGIPSVTREWIFDSVSTFVIQPITNYLLCDVKKSR